MPGRQRLIVDRWKQCVLSCYGLMDGSGGDLRRQSFGLMDDLSKVLQHCSVETVLPLYQGRTGGTGCALGSATNDDGGEVE